MSIISLFEHKTPTEIGELLSYDFNDFIKDLNEEERNQFGLCII